MIRNYLKISIMLAFVVGMVSCNKDVDNLDEQKIIENEQAIEKYLADSSLAIDRDSSGLYITHKTSNPTGVKPKVGDEIRVRYNAYLLNGTKVWTSEKDTVKSIKYPFYSFRQFVLPGMDLGLRLLRTGEKASFFFPFYLAFYGDYDRRNLLTGYSTSASVPEYSAVRVDVELISRQSEIEQIDAYIKAKAIVVTQRTTDNLVISKTKAVAAGDTIGSGKAVNVKYVGKLLDGTVFDPGTKTLPFTTGTGRNDVITGFDRAIRKLKVGEKAIIILPSALGYGNSGRPNEARTNYAIRPYQPITFEVEVL